MTENLKSKTIKATLPFEVVSYAQNREDLILFWLIGQKQKGFYVDVGASEPVDDFSVTRLFYELGWTGINIEPITRLYNRLLEYRPRDINLNIGAGEKKETLEFREYLNGDGLSTFSNMYKKSISSKFKYRDLKINTDCLTHILDKYLPKDKNIDFMKIDVEGFEYEVIAGNDWEKYRPALLCIEANHVLKDWRSIIYKHGYRLVFFDGLNEYWAENEKVVKEQFNEYSDLFLTGRVIEQQRSYNKRKKAAEDYQQLETARAYLKSENDELIRQIDILRNGIHYLSNLNIKASTKQLLKSIYRSVRFRTIRLIWGPTLYANSKRLHEIYDLVPSDKQAAAKALDVISANDALNINLVRQKNKIRKYIYELLRKGLIGSRRLIYKSRQKKDTNA